MPFTIVRNDITRMQVEAIVNAANEDLRMGGGVCGAIFRAAGARKLQRACDRIGHVDTGKAVITRGYGLPARYVIHTAGPIWHGGTHNERALLASCYRSSLELAAKRHCASIAFPLISAGIYGYPRAEAIDVAIEQIRAFLDTHEMDVYLVLFGEETVQSARQVNLAVAEYIDDVYVEESGYEQRMRWEREHGTISGSHDALPLNLPDGMPEETAADDAAGSTGGLLLSISSAEDASAQASHCPNCGSEVVPSARFCIACGYDLQTGDFSPAAREDIPEPPVVYGAAMAPEAVPDAREEMPQPKARGRRRTSAPAPRLGQGARPRATAPQPLRGLLQHLDAGFSQTLMTMIDDRGLKDAEVYKRANVSRQHFSKIRSNPSYQPKKATVLALAIALELPLDDMRLLLERAGFALTHADKRDVVIEYFVSQGVYDIFEINRTLFDFDLQLLG